MKVEALRYYSPTFGIYKGSRKTSYGEYTWGEYRDYKIEIFDAAKKHKEKLFYVSDKKLLNYIKYKFIYVDKNKLRIVRSCIK